MGEILVGTSKISNSPFASQVRRACLPNFSLQTYDDNVVNALYSPWFSNSCGSANNYLASKRVYWSTRGCVNPCCDSDSYDGNIVFYFNQVR